MANWAGLERVYYEVTDSTNRQARRLAAGGASHGTVVVAREQTDGRGRRGRRWDGASGLSLLLSIILRLPADSPNRRILPLAVALAVAEACSSACGLSALVKWPNDVLIHRRKVAGILLENEGEAVIAGVGVNVRQTEADFPETLHMKAASLESLCGARVCVKALETALLAALERIIDGGNCLDAYKDRCATLGARVAVSAAADTFSGLTVGLDASGALLVRDDHGVLRTVYAADVSIRGESGYV